MVEIIALHFVPMGAHLVYIRHPCRPNGRPWTQNVGLWWRSSNISSQLLVPKIHIPKTNTKSRTDTMYHNHTSESFKCMTILHVHGSRFTSSYLFFFFFFSHIIRFTSKEQIGLSSLGCTMLSHKTLEGAKVLGHAGVWICLLVP